MWPSTQCSASAPLTCLVITSRDLGSCPPCPFEKRTPTRNPVNFCGQVYRKFLYQCITITVKQRSPSDLMKGRFLSARLTPQNGANSLETCLYTH
jgi:hypothetical protein